MNTQYTLKDLDVIRSEDTLRGRELVLWGASYKGWYVYNMLKEIGIKIAFCCDSDPNLWGKEFDELVILSPYELKELSLKNPLVILAASMAYYKPILANLHMIMPGEYDIVSYFAISNLFRFHYERLFLNRYIVDKFRLDAMQCREERNRYILSFLNGMMCAENGDIFILQPGKVGSSSLRVELQERGKRVMHIHNIVFPDHILDEFYRDVWNTGLEHLREKKIKYITGVREPIARDVSAFWQSFSEKNVARGDLTTIQNPDLLEMFLTYQGLIREGTQAMNQACGQTTPVVWNNEFDWFDKQFKEGLGIDIYQYPFDKEAGYQIIETEKCSVFLFKLERFDDVYDKIIQFATEGVHTSVDVRRENRGDQKWFSFTYKDFVKKVRLDTKYVNAYYKDNSKMDHFYTEDEKLEFLRKWEANIQNENE